MNKLPHFLKFILKPSVFLKKLRENQHLKMLLIVFLLGFSSGLPLALITSTLQAWFAFTGMSIWVTGLLSLVGLPYAYRWLWSPLIDRYSLNRLGRRRSWIFTMQVILFVGFNWMAFLNPNDNASLLGGVAFLLACFAATQDAAIDAHRTEYLPQRLHALGASMATLGYRMALLLSGGLALVIASYWGWSLTYHVMSLFMLLGLGATFMSTEPYVLSTKKKRGFSFWIEPFKALYKEPGILSLLTFVFCYKLGEAFTTTTSGIVMPFLIQGLGFSLETIGYINKILGITSILLGGLLAGVFLLKYPLYRMLMYFGLFQALTNLLFVFLAMSGPKISLLSLAVFFDNLAAGMGSTALVALFMRVLDKQYTGTQFSILVAFASLPRILSGPFAAKLQALVGWVGLYQLSVIMALFFIPFLIWIKDKTLESNKPTKPLSRKMV